MGATLNYYAVRDEFVALLDKVKALEQTYNCLDEQFKARVSNKRWASSPLQGQQADGGQQPCYLSTGMLPGSFPAASTSNIYN